MKSASEKVLSDIARRLKIKDPQYLKVKQSTDPTILIGRRLAAIILSERFQDPDEGRVQYILQCSRDFVRNSKRLKRQASAEGTVIRSYLFLLTGESVEPDATPEESENPEPHKQEPHLV